MIGCNGCDWVYERVYKWAAGFDNPLPVIAVKILCKVRQ